MDLEKIREQVVLLGKAIENYEELVNNVADARWRFEMVRKCPELGITRNPYSKEMVQITPDDLRKNIEELEKQKKAAAEVLMYLTSTESVDAARQAYLDLFTAYQRVGGLRELERMVAAGFPNALEEAEREGRMRDDDETFEQRIESAKQHLAEVAERVQTPEVSRIDLPNRSLSLS